MCPEKVFAHSAALRSTRASIEANTSAIAGSAPARIWRSLLSADVALSERLLRLRELLRGRDACPNCLQRMRILFRHFQTSPSFQVAAGALATRPGTRHPTEAG